MYVGHLEALGYLLGTQLCNIKPGVLKVDVHKEDEEPIFYQSGDLQPSSRGVKGSIPVSKSTLLAWFRGNEECMKGNVEYKGFDRLNILKYLSFLLLIGGCLI